MPQQRQIYLLYGKEPGTSKGKATDQTPGISTVQRANKTPLSMTRGRFECLSKFWISRQYVTSPANSLRQSKSSPHHSQPTSAHTTLTHAPCVWVGMPTIHRTYHSTTRYLPSVPPPPPPPPRNNACERPPRTFSGSLPAAHARRHGAFNRRRQALDDAEPSAAPSRQHSSVRHTWEVGRGRRLAAPLRSASGRFFLGR